MLFLHKNEFDLSLQYLKKAELLYQFKNITKHQSITLNNLACFYRKCGKLRTALTYLEQALEIEIKEKNEDESNLADTHVNLAAVLSNLKRHNDAIQHCLFSIVYIQNDLLHNLISDNNSDKDQQTSEQKDMRMTNNMEQSLIQSNITNTNNHYNNSSNISNIQDNEPELVESMANTNNISNFDNSSQKQQQQLNKTNQGKQKKQWKDQRIQVLIIAFYNLGSQLESCNRYEEGINIFNKAVNLDKQFQNGQNSIKQKLEDAIKSVQLKIDNERNLKKIRRLDTSDFYQQFQFKLKKSALAKRQKSQQDSQSIQQSSTLAYFNSNKLKSQQFQQLNLDPITVNFNKKKIAYDRNSLSPIVKNRKRGFTNYETKAAKQGSKQFSLSFYNNQKYEYQEIPSISTKNQQNNYSKNHMLQNSNSKNINNNTLQNNTIGINQACNQNDIKLQKVGVGRNIKTSHSNTRQKRQNLQQIQTKINNTYMKQ